MREPRVTLAEVARAAGVSVATVSKVLNERADISPGTRQLVQEHIKRVNYRPTGRAAARPRTVGSFVEVMFPEWQVAYVFELLESITNAARAEGLQVVIGRNFGGPGQKLDPTALVSAGRVGAIFFTVDGADPSVRRLIDTGFPVVVVDPVRVEQAGCPSIGATNFTGGVSATQHLLSLGHTRIAHAAGPESVDCSHARLSGYLSALRQAGRAVDESLITHCHFSYDEGRRAARALLDRDDRPTAVFAANDDIALGVIEEARSRSIRVPDDLSVVGFDDTFLAARSAPPLTTVAQPLKDMGRLAAQALAQTIRGEDVGPNHIELATHLVVRDSTAPPA